MWESWRTYISFGLVGAIFILCQALAGGSGGGHSGAPAADPGDRTYRDTRIEASGTTLPAVRSWLAPAGAAAEDSADGD
jgi:hypothetical protein